MAAKKSDKGKSASTPTKTQGSPAPSKPDGAVGKLIDDVGVTVCLELGRSQITLDEALQIQQHTKLDLNRGFNAPADILVNGTVVARGDVVTVDGNWGVRVTEIVDQD